jgi:hypothetical protein
MGIIFNNSEKRSDLQKRIAAELRDKNSAKPKKVGDVNIVDEEYDAKHSAYRRDLAKSWVPGWVWLVGLALAVAVAYFVANAISGGAK